MEEVVNRNMGTNPTSEIAMSFPMLGLGVGKQREERKGRKCVGSDLTTQN